jgi:hypothetical protein
LAVARPQCLYCGAAIPTALPAPSPEPALAATPAVSDTRTDRVLVIARLEGAEEAGVRAALGLTAYEAAQLTRRGGFHLHRAVAPRDADAERARLLSHGLTAFTVDESDVRAAAEPDIALGGTFDGAALRLRVARQTLTASASDIRLIVKGPITREHSPRESLRFVRTATLDPGFRFHLHRRDVPRPVEIDPAEFDFGAARAGESSLLEIAGWIAEIAQAVPVDDGFRRIAPALAPVITAAGASPKLEDALRTGGPAPAPILDNLAQFRFYSAWRGAVERAARPR